MRARTVASWTSLIRDCIRNRVTYEAAFLFKQMHAEGCLPNEITFVTILKTCDKEQGKLTHLQINEGGHDSILIVGNTLLSMYVKNFSLQDAQRVLDRLSERNVVTWNVMIGGCVQQGLDQEALLAFAQMQQDGVEPNEVTIVCILRAFSSTKELHQGRWIHSFTVENSFDSNVFIGSTLINMYAKCGHVEDGCNIFDRLLVKNEVIVGAMIACYAQNGYGERALLLFNDMQLKGMEPNQTMFSSILKSCADLHVLHAGEVIHSHIIEHCFENDLFVASTLIDMYCKCDNFLEACLVFHKLPKGNIVTWSTMISGCAQYGESLHALQLFQCMQEHGLEPNEVTFVTILYVCSDLAALCQGKLIHAHIIANEFELDPLVGTALIDMYLNCGSLHDAYNVLHKSQSQCSLTWNTMLAGCAQQSDYKLAVQCLGHMQNRGIEPNDVMFVCLLSLCNHMGLVQEGHHYFKCMRDVHALVPAYEHYNCMVDLFGRSGNLVEAEDLLNTMPKPPNIIGLASLLNHSQMHGNIKAANRCFDGAIAINCQIATSFVHISSINAGFGLSGNTHNIKDYRNTSNAWKRPGKASIEVDENVYEFMVGGTKYLEVGTLYVKLQNLSVCMRVEGYSPNLHVLVEFE